MIARTLLAALALSSAPALATAATTAPALLCEEAYLGVYVGDSDDPGATVTRILAGSPAEAAGLRVGDRIVSFGRDEVGDVDDLIDRVAAREAGDVVRLVFLRDGDDHRVSVRLGAKDQADFEARIEPEFAGDGPGVTVRVRPEPGVPATAPESEAWAADFEARMQDFHDRMHSRWSALAEELEARRRSQASNDRLEHLHERLEAMRRRFDEDHLEHLERLPRWGAGPIWTEPRRERRPEPRSERRLERRIERGPERRMRDVERSPEHPEGMRTRWAIRVAPEVAPEPPMPGPDELSRDVERLRAELDRLRQRLSEIEGR